jgi:membrane-bound ClpP family serine protease
MDMKKVAGWSGVGLLIIGGILLVAQINMPEAGIFGVRLQSGFLGLGAVLIGAVLLVVAASGRENSN